MKITRSVKQLHQDHSRGYFLVESGKLGSGGYKITAISPIIKLAAATLVECI